jgi:Transposase DDE domain
MAWLASQDSAIAFSSDTSGYTQARQRLPEAGIEQLLQLSGQALEEELSEARLWQGHRVKLLDGSTLQMCDTATNQAEYPQPSSQKPGCGFPMVKVLVMFSLLSGAVLEVMIAPFTASELGLARQLYARLCPNDVVVADRLYGTYADLSMVQAQGADAVFRLHAGRKSDLKRGKRLGEADVLVQWRKPSPRPKALTPEQFAQLPDVLQVRQLSYQIQQPGFRTKTVTLVTTLLDAKTYTKASLAELYGLRWHAEVNLKHLKTTLKLEFVRCKSPAMVRKDILVHCLSYNLLRTLMFDSVVATEIPSLQLSIQSARQLLVAFLPQLMNATEQQRDERYHLMLILLWEQRLPQRPNRVEPRAVKRRPKSYPRLTRPRVPIRSTPIQIAV